MLPDIYKSGIWKKHAGSIVEYCGKYGDIARTTVVKRLRLEENLIDKPFLRAAIEQVGVHKVAMVAKVATAETDKSYAEKVIDMSKAAVQSLSKEVRISQKENGASTESGLFENTNNAEQNPKSAAVPTLKKIELDADASFLFMKLKAKFGKHMSDAKFLKTILENTDVANEPKTKNIRTKSLTGDTFQKPVTRYVPVLQERGAIAETNGRCSYPNCNHPYAVIHHTDRFSESKSHDSIILLCKIHHEFAHNNLIENETKCTDSWRMLADNNPTNLSRISPADVLYRKYRQKKSTIIQL